MQSICCRALRSRAGPSFGIPSSTSTHDGGRRHRLTSLGRSRRRSPMASAGGPDDKSVLVPLGDGSEEMEAVITVDVLRRAGAKVTIASVEDDLTVTCSRGVKIVADAKIEDCASSKYDLIALPGGAMGAEKLRDSKVLSTMLLEQSSSNAPYAAICAAPAVVLEGAGLLNGKKATAHPAFVDKLADQSQANNRVVVDGNLITSRGPGTAFEFALALVNQLYGEEKMNEVATPMVMYKYTE